MTKNGLFFAQISGFRENRQKSKKSGCAMFLTFFTPNSMPNFGENPWSSFWDNALRTDARTDAQDWFYRSLSVFNRGPKNFFTIFSHISYFGLQTYIFVFLVPGWKPRGTYKISIVRPCVRACVPPTRIISETAPRIFPKSGMKLGVKKCQKRSTAAFFRFLPVLA